MTTGIIIQVHDKSTRLPQKLFKVINNMTVLEHVIKTCHESIADKIICATTTDPINDNITLMVKTFLKKYPKLSLYRFHGEDNNVLSRYYHCSKEHKLNDIIRITSDCPLHSSHIINLCIKAHQLCNSDYTSFTSIDGMDTEVFTFKVLEDMYNNAKESYQLEHVTPWIKNNSNYKKIRLEDIKISLDTPDDLRRIEQLW